MEEEQSFASYFLYSLSHCHFPVIPPSPLSPPNPHAYHTALPTPHTPHLSYWYSVQFKLVVTGMSSTGDHGRSKRKDALDPIPTSLEWKWEWE